MPAEPTAAGTPAAAAEPTISDLRKLLAGDEPAAAAKVAPATEKPAPSGKPEEKSAPDPDPETQQEAAAETAAERDADGKFKAKEPADPEGVKKRIGKALQAQREAERERDELRARLATNTQASPPAKEQAQPVSAPGKPDAAKFDSYEAYVEALTDWKVDQKDAARAAKAAAEKSAAGWTERVAAARTVHADFDDVLAEAASTPISRAMHDAIVDSEAGPALAYHLAQHPAEATRIAALAPLAAARELGKLEAKLSQQPEPAKPAAAATPLPRPAKAVGGGHAPASVDLNDPALDFGAFKREIAKRRAD